MKRFAPRPYEAALLIVVFVIAGVGFFMVDFARQLRLEQLPTLTSESCIAPLVLVVCLYAVHFLLRLRGTSGSQLLWPITGLLVAVGLIVIFRLLREDGVWQQLSRGWLPGVFLVALLIIRPSLVEWMRRGAIVISLGGLGLLLATALQGGSGTGGSLALQIGPLPPVQTSELIKLALIIFLAWYIERVGAEAEGRARPVIWLRLPSLRYFVPGLLFVGIAALALVRMSDFGAILIVGSIFVAMLYAGFDTRTFLTVALIGLSLLVVLGLLLGLLWEPPDTIRHRFIAFQDPWSEAPLVVNGEPTDITVAEGPGYQIQQSLYAVVAGGLTGTGLGFGTPYFVPLAHSDFIFAAVVEELGGLIALALLFFFGILLLRFLRLSMLLPESQLFERLLLIGIGVHLFTQIFVMVGGTLNMIPLTGITVPFLSLGGVALTVNLAEVGIALALAQRLT